MKSRLLTFTAGGVLGAFAAIIILIVIVVAACPLTYPLIFSTINGYSLALEEGKQSIIYAQQFSTLYPDAVHSFSYYTGQYGTPTWNSKIGLYGRYILSMQIPVQFNKTRTSIVEYGEPKFYLDEIISITRQGERLLVNHGSQVEFGKEKWELLLKRQGDISVLDEKIQKDKPIAGFEEYWSEDN